MNTVSEESDTIWVTELWSSEEAHDRSLKRKDVRALIQRGLPLMAGVGEQVRLAPVGGNGIR